MCRNGGEACQHGPHQVTVEPVVASQQVFEPRLESLKGGAPKGKSHGSRVSSSTSHGSFLSREAPKGKSHGSRVRAKTTVDHIEDNSELNNVSTH